MTVGQNPYKAEFTRRTLQHAVDASAAMDRVTRDLEASSRAKSAEMRRRDVTVLETMLALIDHAYVAGSGLASLDLFPTTPNYKEAKWLINIALATRDAPEAIREGVKKEMASSCASKMPQVGHTVVAKGKSAMSALKWCASPRGHSVANTFDQLSSHMSGLSLAPDYVQKILLKYSPMGLSTTVTSKAASIVMHILGNWGSCTAEQLILSRVMPFFTPLSQALQVLSVEERLGQMQSLAERYQDHCSCHGAIEKIYLGWMSWLTAKAINPIPGVGFATNVVAAGAMSAAHRIHKKVDSSAHQLPFYIATDLWQAARRPTERGFKCCAPGKRNRSVGLREDLYAQGRCPVALLALATLFGNGDAGKGATKAAAAVVAEQYDAVKKTKHVIDKKFGNVVERTMAKFDWCV